MSALGSNSDVSLTSSLLRNESYRNHTSRFTLDELAAITGNLKSSSSSQQRDSYDHRHDRYKEAKRLLQTIRLKTNGSQTSPSLDDVLEIIKRKGRRKNRKDDKNKVLEEEPTHRDMDTQTEEDVEDIIKELEALEKQTAVVSGTRHYYRKSTSPVNRDSDIQKADELLRDLDKAIFRNSFTQTRNLGNKRFFKQTIDFPLPQRNVQCRTDHRWPKGHKLHVKLRAGQDLHISDS